jgi:putative PLP-dependent aminotransferase (TIGR04422 family)
MNASFFLWPKPNLKRALLNSACLYSISQVENKLASMFPGAVPVLFSSGRAALLHALLTSALGRGDRVGVFPFASHCVLDAVARVTTPIGIGGDVRLNVVFQQWGYIQHHDLSRLDLEDCVDSLLVPGGKLFPGGGAFEIWSLPKILGTTGGGVLWCRSAETADLLRRGRDEHGAAGLLWCLRLLGLRFRFPHACWQGAEPSMGRPTRLQTGELLAALDTWHEVVADRWQKFKIVQSLAPNWLPVPEDRLPCVVPVVLSEKCDGEVLARQAGISSGQRMIECPSIAGHAGLVRVLPIPIHQDVSISQLGVMMGLIAPNVRGLT